MVCKPEDNFLNYLGKKRKDAMGQDLAMLWSCGATGQLTEAGLERGSVFTWLLLYVPLW